MAGPVGRVTCPDSAALTAFMQDASAPSHSRVEEVLASVGFTPEMQAAPVASLSGGWKMKLALARAMLMNADILLLGEACWRRRWLWWDYMPLIHDCQ